MVHVKDLFKKRIKEARQKKSTIGFLWYKILENENYL